MYLCWGVSEDGAALLLLLLLHGRVLCACVFRDEECSYLHEVLQRNRCPCLMIVKILWSYPYVFVGRAPSHTTNHQHDIVKVMNATAKNCQGKSRVDLMRTTDIRIKYDVWGQVIDMKERRVY